MNKFLNSRNKKISATVSLVWLVFWYANTMTGYDKNFQLFFIIGLIPIIIGWGVFFIWQKEFEETKLEFIFNILKNLSSKNKPENKNKKSSSGQNSKISHIVASGLGIIAGILLFRLFGLPGVVSFGLGAFLYLKLIKTENKLFSITVSTLVASISYVVIVGTIYLIKYY